MSTRLYYGIGYLGNFWTKIRYFTNIRNSSRYQPSVVIFTEEILNGKLHFLCSVKLFLLPHFFLIDIGITLHFYCLMNLKLLPK